jgi:hypothetical protein
MEFLRSLTRRGLRGVKLVISDAHLGLKTAIAKVFKATWQRCRVHFMRNALAYAGKGQRQMVLALIDTAFAQGDRRSGACAVGHRRRPAAHEVSEARGDDRGRQERGACFHGLSEGTPHADRLDQSTRTRERRDQEAH